MASACVNDIGIPSESFLDCSPVKYPSHGRLKPRFPLSREFHDEEGSSAPSSKPSAKSEAKTNNAYEERPEISDPEISGNSFIDFEFLQVDPVAMLTADELFSDGKLLPLHLSTIRRSMMSHPASSEIKSEHVRRRIEISSADPYLFSPKAPSCTARWKDILGLKKLYQNGNGIKQDAHKTTSSNSKFKQFLPHRVSKCDSSLNLPLLKEPENESLSISSRLSLSSSSSGHEHDDLPRHSLDSDKPNTIPRNTQHVASNLSKIRVSKQRSTENQTASHRGQEPTVPADSPRMNSSGKIVFHGLERSSSSPSAFNGGNRPYKSRGMERSYSANVRITPVLNVPVCTLRGSSKSGVFGLFSTQQKKDSCNTVGANRNHVKNRSDRT
ncbi:hypothetical protein CASFOL_040526 [Castilleja foliolosa]|uniref:Uncharacterized protein n=1 Tax=Castilleja foliolosa TaxID=1961234 RepID=A0ABD3BBW4_9LAMI